MNSEGYLKAISKLEFGFRVATCKARSYPPGRQNGPSRRIKTVRSAFYLEPISESHWSWRGKFLSIRQGPAMVPGSL